MPRPVFTRFEDAVTTAIEILAEVTRSDAQGIVEADAAKLQACFDAAMSVDLTAAHILGATEPLTADELAEADALTSANVCDVATLDELLDKWTAHRYRPTLFMGDAGRERLADLYDRRALERGILVSVFRAGAPRPALG